MVGMIVRTKAGKAVRERIERSLFERIPGYALLRSLTQRLVGEDRENVWYLPWPRSRKNGTGVHYRRVR